MFPIEQIAHHTDDMAAKLDQLKSSGLVNVAEMVRDTVSAAHLYLHPSVAPLANGQSTFKVELAFDYALIPGIELEFIQQLDGFTVQLHESLRNATLSHYGYHVSDWEEGEDALADTLTLLAGQGFTVEQVSQTTHHTGTPRRYRYAFVDMRELLGVHLKVIQRVRPHHGYEPQVQSAREAYANLLSQFERR